MNEADLRALEGLRYRDADLRGRRGPRHGHVESWFLHAREPGGRRAIWVRHVVFARAAPEDAREPRAPAMAESWAVAFDRESGHVAVKSAVPFERARFATRGLDLEVDGAALDRHRAHGHVMSGGRAVAWELAVGARRAAPVLHLPRALYAPSAPFPSMKLVTSVPDALATGHVRIDRGEGAAAEAWDVSSWSTVLGHAWGHASPAFYGWAQASAWDVDDLVVEAVCARVRLGRVPLLSPVLAGVFVRFRGRSYDFGPFEGFAKNVATVSPRRFEVEARSKEATISFEGFAETDELVGLHYPDPDAVAPRAVLASAVAHARVELRLHDGSHRTVTARSRAASLEIGTQEAEHGVAMHV